MKYSRIAGRFHFGSAMTLKEYVGHVIASDDALYLKPDANAIAAGLGLMGGLPGYMAASKIQSWAGLNAPMQTTIEELPEEITSHKDWPIGHKKGDIIILPKDIVHTIKYPWYGALTMETDEHKFTISPVVFARGKVLKSLKTLGWEVS